VDPGRYDELLVVAPDVIAAITRLPGYQQIVAGGDRTDGRTIAVSTFDTEEHARFSRDALSDVMSKLQAVGAQLDPPDIFEVFP